MPEESGIWQIPAAIVGTLILVGWAIVSVSAAASDATNLCLYLLANLILMIDAIDFGFRWYLQRDREYTQGPDAAITAGKGKEALAASSRTHVRPWAIVVSVFNVENDLDDFLEAMEPYRNRVWIIDDASTDNTVSVLRQAGWRCLEGSVNRKKPAAIRLLLSRLPATIETVLVMDPDTTIQNLHPARVSDLESAIVKFQASDAAAMCPRIKIRDAGLLTQLQALEYALSFGIGRKSLGDCCLTSGISMYSRSVLESALERHSLSVYAEDCENSLLVLSTGASIRYAEELTLITEGKLTVRGWFSQRVGWSYGLIRVYLLHFGCIRKIAARRLGVAYHYLIYFGLFSLLLQPLKILALLVLAASCANGIADLLGFHLMPGVAPISPIYFASIYAKYTALILMALFVCVPKGERKRLVPAAFLYFLYVLMSIVPNAIGFANWFTARITGKRIVSDHYQDDASFMRERTGAFSASMEQL